MQQLSPLNQLILGVAFAARQQFPRTPIRIWYVMLDNKAWKGIVINTVSKVKLAEGPVKTTLMGSLNSFKTQLEKNSTKKSGS